MLHRDAKTKFILRKMTRAIDVNFSIRQGDPLAMMLYIIYAEPLLIYIEERVSGLPMLSFSQSTEAFCDDLNVMTNKLDDLEIVDEAVRKFEKVSGAILSRNRKCKIIGLGAWKDKLDWPLDYLQTVDEIKVFGFFIMNSFKGLVKKNWNWRITKVQQSLMAWSSRHLESIYQRVEVINIFALSIIFYVASILPISKTVVQQLEKSIGKFIWNASGKILRVSMADIKNPKSRGGLGLLCLETMGKSLRLSQLLRLMKNGNEKSQKHIDFWMGDMIAEFHTDYGLGLCAKNVPGYFSTLAENVAQARILDIFSEMNWNTVSNKMIYQQFISTLPVTKAEMDAGMSKNETWRKLQLPVLPSTAREVVYLLIHNKLPLEERLYRLGISNDPYCTMCVGGFVGDREHFFTTCHLVINCWTEIRKIVGGLLSPCSLPVSDLDILGLSFPKGPKDISCVWIVGNYVEFMWRALFIKKVQPNSDEMFGFLKYKYKADQLGARESLNIPELES